MDFKPNDFEQEARRMRSEAVANWLGTLPQRFLNKMRALVAFIQEFRSFRGVRA